MIKVAHYVNLRKTNIIDWTFERIKIEKLKKCVKYYILDRRELSQVK